MYCESKVSENKHQSCRRVSLCFSNPSSYKCMYVKFFKKIITHIQPLSLTQTQLLFYYYRLKNIISLFLTNPLSNKFSRSSVNWISYRWAWIRGKHTLIFFNLKFLRESSLKMFLISKEMTIILPIGNRSMFPIE